MKFSKVNTQKYIVKYIMRAYQNMYKEILVKEKNCNKIKNHPTFLFVLTFETFHFFIQGRH